MCISLHRPLNSGKEETTSSVLRILHAEDIRTHTYLRALSSAFQRFDLEISRALYLKNFDGTRSATSRNSSAAAFSRKEARSSANLGRPCRRSSARPIELAWWIQRKKLHCSLLITCIAVPATIGSRCTDNKSNETYFYLTHTIKAQFCLVKDTCESA